jgi:hypothetical protein
MQLQPFGLCANLIFCDESTDSQAVLRTRICPIVNQLRNIALETQQRCRNFSAGWPIELVSGSCPSHPQIFPQGRGVSGSGSTTGDRMDGSSSLLPRPWRNFPFKRHQNVAYSLGSLLPSSIFAKRVELCRKARLNLPMGPFRCLAMMISARPLRSGSSCL